MVDGIVLSTMAKTLSCREAGHDCDFEITSENEHELVDFVQIHSRSVHGDQVDESDVRSMIEAS